MFVVNMKPIPICILCCHIVFLLLPYVIFRLKIWVISKLEQVKEKTIAARRSNVKTIIFPSANRRDFDELADNVKEGLDVRFVDNYNQILELAFESEDAK